MNASDSLITFNFYTDLITNNTKEATTINDNKNTLNVTLMFKFKKILKTSISYKIVLVILQLIFI